MSTVLFEMSGVRWPEMAVLVVLGRQVGSGMAVSRALGRQVGPGMAVVGPLDVELALE